MKKLLVVLMVLAFVAPAMADDTLDVSGAYRLEYYNISSSDFRDASPATNDLDFWDQRFRLQFAIKPADGVTAVLRGDFTEANWGTYETRPAAGTNDVIMIDKAFVSINKGMVNVTAGLNGWTLGDAFGYANQDTGLAITIKPKPVSIRLGFVKEDEGSATDDETPASDDTNHYFLDIGFKGSGVAGNVYYATQMDDNGAEADEPNMFGAMVKAKLAMVNIKATLEVFGGDNGAAPAVDYTGVQLYIDANAKLSDAFKLGAEVVYSDGNNSTTETKIARFGSLANSAYRQYLERGPLMGTLVLRALGGADIFSVDGDQAGSIGIRPYVEFKPMPALTLYANVGYFAGDEDVDTVDSILTYSLGALWAFAPKTTVGVQYLAVDPDKDDNAPVGDFNETYSALAAIMKVKF